MRTWRGNLLGLVGILSVLLALLPLAPARADFGTNWTALFYNNTNLSGGPVVTQSGLPGVNFNWGSGSPASGVNNDQFSARFTATQTFAGGTYDFVVTADDGVRVLIDGQMVLDRFYARPVTTDRFTQTLTPGAHSLTVEYFEEGDQAQIQFQWFLTSPAVQPTAFVPPVIVPTFVLTPGVVVTAGPTPSPTPMGPQATISFVRALALRTGPYLGATYVTRIDRSYPSYNVIGRNDSEGVYNWYLIQTPDGRQGWGSGRYLDLDVDISQVPVLTSVFDQINDAPDIGVVAIPRSVMVLRQYPSTRARDIGRIGYGEYTQLIGRTVQANIDQWYQVRQVSTGLVGWVYAPWVTVHGEIKQVPIR
jgi:hypothetical protein